MTTYKGTRWYKCDLHLHTTSSECYLDKNNTPEDWVARAAQQGLSAIAVTDHNDYRGIAPIMAEAEKYGIAVFPGVEITCDSSKIHMLIIFDVNKNPDTVRDFLNRCDIDSELVGSSAGTNMSIFEVCEIAKKRGALVVASHIDEFSSINSMNPANLKRLFEGDYIDAVQVANTHVWQKYKADKNTEEMIAELQNKYGPGANAEEIDRWRKCCDRAEAAGIPMLAFSDNPATETESHHGLWGIGSNYTWIKMDESIDLESIRQALITPEERIRTKYESPEQPQTEPDFWIKSIDIKNTVLNPHQPIHLDFHPQLNCIIGGRGSGKSAIVHVLSGVYRALELSILDSCIEQQNSYYKQLTDDGTGIFNEESEVTIDFVWFGMQARLVVYDIMSPTNQSFTVYEIDSQTGEAKETSLGIHALHALLSADVFIENQIQETAKTSRVLLNYIDAMIPDMYIFQNQKDYHMKRIVSMLLELDALNHAMLSKEQVVAEYDWLKTCDNDILLTETRKNNFKSALEIRTKAMKMFDKCEDELETLSSQIDKHLEAYEELLVDITNKRQVFINSVMADDEHYKIAVEPCSSRESFNRMISSYIPVQPELIAEDTKKLEAMLFGNKGSRRPYEDTLMAIRTGDSHEFSDFFTHQITQLNPVDFQMMVHFHPDDELSISYRPPGAKKYFPMNKASAGEKLCAVMAFVLACGVAPLIIDQPEDSIDNRVMYEEIIPKIKRAKQNKQMILITHSANIAANADAELIISLDSKSKFMRIREQGTLDNTNIRRELCDILEGSQDAFIQRAKKYRTEDY